MSMKNPWDNDPIVSPPVITRYGAPKPVDPLAARDQAIQEQQLGFAANRDARDARGEVLTTEGKAYDNQSKPIYDRANAMDKIRDGYRQDKRVLMFEAAAPIYASALTSPNTPESDILLINAIAKIGDPSTGVQQREGDAYEGAAPTLDQIKARLGKEFGLDGAGNFTPEGRKRIKEAIRNRGAAIGDQYRLARAEHAEYIKSLNLPDVDPEKVIGQSGAIPFQRAEEAYLGRPLRLIGDEAAPGAVGGVIKFNDELPDEPTNFRMTPEQTAQWQGYLARNKSKLSADAMGAAYEAITGVGLNPDQSQKVIDYIAKGGDPRKVGVDYSKTDALTPEQQARVDARLKGTDATGAAVNGVGDTVTMGTIDEMAARGDAILGAIQGEGSLGDLYDENIEVERAFKDALRDRNPVAYTGGQIAGGLILPTTALRAGLPAGRAALRAGANRAGANTAARNAVANRAGIEGAAYSGAYGFGSGEGDAIDRAPGALGGAVLGLAAGQGLTRGGALLGLGRPSVGAVERNALAAIAERQGIAPTPATVGGPVSGAIQLGALNIPGFGGPAIAAVERESQGLADAARRVAGQMGPVTNPESAGRAVSRGAQAYQRLTGREGSRLYGERDRLMGGADVPVELPNAAAALQQFTIDSPSSPLLADLMQHPAVRQLAGIAQEGTAAPGGTPQLTLAETTRALSHMRGALRNATRNGQTTPEITRNLARVEQALESDVMAAAQQADQVAGRIGEGSAVAAQRSADRYWRTKRTTESGAMSKALQAGDDPLKTSGTAVFRDISGAMNRASANPTKVQTLWNSLPQGARRNFAATKFDELGRATDGAQGEAGNTWSFNTFMTNWNKLDRPSRALVFGTAANRDLTDIVRYASRLKEVDRSRNFSNTARAGIAGAFLTVFGGQVMNGDLIGAAKSTVAIPVAAFSARAFVASPAMRTWFRRAMQQTLAAVQGTPNATQQLQGLRRRLPAIATREPALAQDILGLRQTLENAFSQSGATRAAAEEQRD